MPRLTSFSIPGLELFFNSSDHKPPHFHVLKKGEWEARIYFQLCHKGHLEYKMKWPKSEKIPAKTQKLMCSHVLENLAKLLVEWEKEVLVVGEEENG